MAGKSTFLRQNALIVVLAQAGLPVPAESASIGIVDRLFSRVGAADDLARGRSTFMVEMTETAAILHQAGPRSLVVVDEIGRGTSTLDGLAIAWAVLEALHSAIRCRTIFATHFHELAELADRLPRLKPHTMRVKEWKGTVVFLHEVAEGAAGRSWGVHVAELAGVPAPVVRRAASLMAALEKHGGPLGSAARRSGSAVIRRNDFCTSAGRAIDAGQRSAGRGAWRPGTGQDVPKEALDALYRLKLLVPGCTMAANSTINAMLTPIPLPRAPEAAASVLSDALAGFAGESGSVSRDAAVGAFRRHLARIQSHVQHAFEQEQITGLQAARLLGALIDGVVSALFDHATGKAELGIRRPPLSRRDRRLWPWRAGTVQRYRSVVPHS